MQTPPGSAMPSSRAAMLTPSPKISSPSAMMNVYYGVAQRACDIPLPAVRNKTSLAVSLSMA